MELERGLSPRGFVVLVLTTTISLVLALAGLAFVVDPHGIHRIVELPWLNEIKPRASQSVVAFKYRTIEDLRPRTVILGNSRAEMGIDPKRIETSGLGVTANLSVPGSGLNVMRTIADFSWEVSRPATIVLGVEFFDCLEAGAARPRTTRVPPPWPARTDQVSSIRSRIGRISSDILSLDTVADAIATIAAQYQPAAAHLRRDGFQPGRDYSHFVLVDGPRKMFQQRESETARTRARGPKSIRYQNGDLSECFVDYEAILENARERSQHVIAFTYPYHARLLEIIRALGLWPSYEAWKVEIARIAQESRTRGARVRLLDFGAYHAYATERIPLEGRRQPVPMWYWESGHFKPELGDRVVERLLGGRDDDDLFGMELTDSTIDSSIEAVRASRARFAGSQPDVVREMESLVRQVEARTTRRP